MKKIVLLFLLVISMQLWGKEINGNYSNFLYYKDAMKSGSEVRITPDEGGKRGAVWSRNIFDLNEKFHFEYEIYLGTKGIESFENLKKENPNLNMEDRYISNGNVDIGADGMAFAFKSSAYKNDHYGNAGQSIGYGGGNFPLSFGVKFDTYTNPYYDPQYNSNIDSVENLTEDHIAFIAKGKIGTMIDSGITGGRGPAPYIEVGDMEDGKWHKVTFDWDPGVLDSYGNRSGSKFTYTFDNNNGTLHTDTYSEDIIKKYLGNDRYVYFGFTSSTGQWMNEHKFRNPEIKGTIPTDDYKLDIKKEVVNGNNYTLANDKDNPIKYKITITNTGSETLTNVMLKDGKDISDEAIVSDVILETSTWNELKAGQSVVTYGTKIAIQADIDEGSVIRTATVEAQKSNGEKLYAAAEAIVYPNIVEGLEVSKTIETEGEFKYTKAGDVIIYNFSIKNTGTTTLTDVSVSDLKIPGIKLTPTTLAPEAIATGTGSYTVIQADVDTGKVDNTANFRAVKPDGNVIGKSSTVTAPGKVTNSYTVSNTPVITDKDDKSVVDKYSKVGDIVTYTLSLTNTGNGTLKTPMVEDTNSSAKVSLDKTELAPTETAKVTVTHTVTQEDLDDGTIVNPAVFDVTDVNGTPLDPQTKDAPVSGDITNSYTVDNQAIIADKDGAPLTEYSSVSDIVTYTLSLTNTGNGTLKTPMVEDTNTGKKIPLDVAVLAPGKTAKVIVTHKVTQTDLDKGTIENLATFDVTDVNDKALDPQTKDAPVSGDITNSYEVSNTPVITDEDDKSVVDKYTKAGDIVTYTVTMKNTGNATLKDIVITDTNNTSGITLDETTLAPGETATGTVTHAVTQEDLDAGKILNPAHFTAKDSALIALPEKEAPATVTGVIASSLEVHKTIPGTDEFKYTKAGDKITYNFSVENTGNTTLKDVKVTDPKITAEIVMDKTVLAPGDIAIGSGKYTVTQADVDAGQVDNTATFTGTAPNGDPVAGTDSITAKGTTATYKFDVSNTPRITTKGTTTEIDKYTQVGDVVTYTVTLTNTGTGTLKDVVIRDTNKTSGITLDNTILISGGVATGTVEHIVTQEDIDAGKIVNPSLFDAKDFTGKPLPQQDVQTLVEGIAGAPSIEVHKTIPGTDEFKYTKAGDKIAYNFSIKNTGNTTLKDVKVTDPKITAEIVMDKTVLAPGDIAIGSGKYTVTQADVDTGQVDNTATFTGTAPNGDPVTGTDSITAKGTTATYKFDVSNIPRITTKGTTTEIDKYTQVGDVVTYTVTLTNTGTGTLKDVVIRDTNKTSGITLDNTILISGGVATGTVEHIVTQEDIDAGKIVNPSLFDAKDFTGKPLPQQDVQTLVEGIAGAPSIEVHKTIPGTDEFKYTKAGDKIAYNFSIKNTGNTTLKDVKVTDPKIPTGITLDKTVLAPGDIAIGSGKYTVTQADVDTGQVDNTATFTGTAPNGDPVTGTDSITAKGTTATYKFDVSNIPRITTKGTTTKGTTTEIDKYTQVGNVVTYTVTLTNTGTGTLKDVVIRDTNKTSGITLDNTILISGGVATGTVEHIVTQEDIDAGKIVNPSLFDAKDFTGKPLPQQDVQTLVEGIAGAPSIEVHKTIPGTEEFKYTKAGDKITYNFSVKNTGNTTLKDVKVTDPKITAEIVMDKTVLAPDEIATGSGEYTVTQADVDAGQVDNTATFTGTAPNGDPVSEEDTVTAPGKVTNEYTVSNTPEIKDGGKVVDKYSRVGDMVTYTVTLKNTGNTTLKDVVVTDMNNTTGIKLDKIELAPNETATGTVTHTITQEDLDAETIVNPAHFTVKDAALVALPKKEATATVNGKTIIDLSIEKTVSDDNGNGKAETDERLKYIITVNNNSNITITNSKLIDTLASRFFRDQNPKNLEVKGTSYQGDLKTGMTLDSIPVGKSVEIAFEMIASYPADVLPGEKIENTAIISYGKESKNATADIPVISISSLDLDIKLQVEDLGGDGFERGDGIVDDGEEAEYTISITNPTPVNAVNVLVSDDYNDLYLYKNDSYKYVSSEEKRLTGKDLKKGVIISEIKAGETIKLKFMVGFSYEGKNVDQDDTIPNEAYLSLQETSSLKKLRRLIAPINKSSNKVVLNVAKPTYSLSKEIRNKKDEFYPGDIVTYDITLENTSKVIGKNIKIEDKVSAIKAFESWTWERGTSKTLESSLKTNLRKDLSENGIELLAGETKRYTVIGRLKDTISKGEVKNTVKAGGNLELQAEATLKVADAQIKVTKTAKKKWVSIGDLISYKITVQNLSGNKGSVLKNLSLKDMMPPGFKYVEGSGKVDGNDTDEDLKGRTIYFNNLELIGDKKIEITYILRIGTGVKPGSYKNKAWIENTSGKNLSNIGEASVEVINDPLFNSTVIIGKVFHDRDNDGWQDDANAYDIRVQTLSSQENYLDGSVKKGDEEWRTSLESKELLLGNLDGRGDESENAQKVILRRRIKDPKKIGDILIKSKEGSNITLKSTGEVLRNHSGNRNLTGVNLKVVRRIIKDPKYRKELKDVKRIKKVRIENFIEPIYFDSAYAAIRGSENEKLKQYMEKLSDKKNLKLVIVGYSDSQRLSKRAKYKNNHELSLARANTLKDYLSMKLDLSEEMFAVEGKGASNPKGTNRTSIGRQLNRRTEIVIEYDEEIMEQIPLKVDESDYFEEVEIRNDGISEEGIPGVRLATVEGLVIETDQFGRYHVDGIDDIPDRGKNFIIKVDKVTLPSGTEFTTENPRVKTLTKVMEKFNFGVKIPKAKRRVKEKEIKVRVGSVFFPTDKWNVREDQIDNLKKISSLLTEYRGGVIVVEGNTDSRASNKYNEILALKRAKSIGKELEKIMGKDMISNVKIVTDLSGGGR